RWRLAPPATPAPHLLSLHDALPICEARVAARGRVRVVVPAAQIPDRAAELVDDARLELEREPPEEAVAKAHHEVAPGHHVLDGPDRKSTRLNSSHVKISYAVFCLKK